MAEYIFLKYSKGNSKWNIFAVDIIPSEEAASILFKRLRRRKNGFIGCFDIFFTLAKVTPLKSTKVNFPVRGYIRLGGPHEVIKVQEILRKRGEAVICEDPKKVCKRKGKKSNGKLFCCIRKCEKFKREKERFLLYEQSREKDRLLRLNQLNKEREVH